MKEFETVCNYYKATDDAKSLDFEVTPENDKWKLSVKESNFLVKDSVLYRGTISEIKAYLSGYKEKEFHERNNP